MTHTLTLELPEDVFAPLAKSAKDAGRTLEEVARDLLANALREPEDDPLMKLAGTIECDLTDVSDRHDYYLGQNLYREMRGESGHD